MDRDPQTGKPKAKWRYSPQEVIRPEETPRMDVVPVPPTRWRRPDDVPPPPSRPPSPNALEYEMKREYDEMRGRPEKYPVYASGGLTQGSMNTLQKQTHFGALNTKAAEAPGGARGSHLSAINVPAVRKPGAHLVDSLVPGRVDRIPMRARTGSFVIPADVVSGLGQGNTKAGAKMWGDTLSHATGGGSAMKMGHPRPMSGSPIARARTIAGPIPRPPAPPRSLLPKQSSKGFADGGLTRRFYGQGQNDMPLYGSDREVPGPISPAETFSSVRERLREYGMEPDRQSLARGAIREANEARRRGGEPTYYEGTEQDYPGYAEGGGIFDSPGFFGGNFGGPQIKPARPMAIASSALMPKVPQPPAPPRPAQAGSSDLAKSISQAGDIYKKLRTKGQEQTKGVGQDQDNQDDGDGGDGDGNSGFNEYQGGGGVDDTTPIIVAGGEMIVDPEVVAALGDGDSRAGTEILRNSVDQLRKQIAGYQKKLPRPTG